MRNARFGYENENENSRESWGLINSIRFAQVEKMVEKGEYDIVVLMIGIMEH